MASSPQANNQQNSSSRSGYSVFKDSALSTAVSILGLISSFLIGIQLARGLGVEGYGVYGLAMSILALVTVPIELGLPQLLVRETSTNLSNKCWGRMRGALNWSDRVVFSASVVVAGIFLLVLSGLDKAIDDSLSATLYVGLVLIPIVAFGKLRCAAIMGLQRVVRGQVPDTLLRPAIFSLTLLITSILAIALSPAWAMALGCCSAIASLISANLLLRNVLPAQARHVTPQVNPPELLRSALPMALTEGMRMLQGNLAILFLGLLATTDLVALFRVGASVGIIVGLPATIMNLVVAPGIARLYAEKNHADLQRLLTSASLAMILFTLFLVFPLVLFGNTAISLAFGDSFVAANSVLLIFCLKAVLDSLSGPAAILLNMTGHHSFVSRSATVSVVIILVSGPPLITFYPATGAAFTTLLSTFTWHILMWRKAVRSLGLNPSFISFPRMQFRA